MEARNVRPSCVLGKLSVLIGNVAAGETRTEEQFRGSDEGLYNWQFKKTRLRDMEPGYEASYDPQRPGVPAVRRMRRSVCSIALLLVCLELKPNSYDYRTRLPSIS